MVALVQVHVDLLLVNCDAAEPHLVTITNEHLNQFDVKREL